MGSCIGRPAASTSSQSFDSQRNSPSNRQQSAGNEPSDDNPNAFNLANDSLSLINQRGHRSAQGSRPETTAPLHFKNRFIDKLREQKHLFTEKQQMEIEHLEIYDSLKHKKLKNSDLRPIENAFESSDKETRIALKRTASFLLIKEVLEDMESGVAQISRNNDADKFSMQFMLTVQSEALRHQVQIGKHELLDRISRNDRLAPMLASSEKFDRFLHNEKQTLREIVHICGTDGNRREPRLAMCLQHLAHNYLKAARRLPAGCAPGQLATFDDIEVSEEKVKVALRANWDRYGCSSTSRICPDENPLVALIVIDPEDATTASDDPCEGSPDERYYALGFEHCSVAEKQAAVFLQKLFYELEEVELRLASSTDPKSTAFPVDANLAARFEFESGYRGAFAIKDRCYSLETDPSDQRKDVLTKVSKLGPLANAFPSIANGKALLLDADLNAWVKSPRFEKDLACLQHPEFRAWILNAEIAKTALQKSSVFSG